MEEDEFLSCISCLSTNDLYDLFALYEDNGETYASMFKTCFDVKIPTHAKYMCADCAGRLEKAAAFKEQTVKSVDMMKQALSQDEEYLDETILEEEDKFVPDEKTALDEVKKDSEDDEFGNDDDLNSQYGEMRLNECDICGLGVAQLEQHMHRCHSKTESPSRQYPCHFCENVYVSKKACFTHLRMKHGLKLCTEQAAKFVQRERKKCHMCSRDFSQKQILNKHLWKAHGFEVEKRKAFCCPLCPERVSYGSNFSTHLLRVHNVHETVEKLQFQSMDDFLQYKSAIQEETKYRFRKTTASKQTIEGVRSHYMCSQSGVYVYQGKGKRPAPERQIYKTGKACPAHMIVTETLDSVLVTFYKTHVGHGPCPYFEPREPKKPKLDQPSTSYILPSDIEANMIDTMEEQAICDACGLVCADGEQFKEHAATHGVDIFPCQYCQHDFQNMDAWTRHVRADHNVVIF